MFVLAREGSLLFSYFDLKMFAPSAEGFYTRICSSPRWRLNFIFRTGNIALLNNGSDSRSGYYD